MGFAISFLILGYVLFSFAIISAIIPDESAKADDQALPNSKLATPPTRRPLPKNSIPLVEVYLLVLSLLGLSPLGHGQLLYCKVARLREYNWPSEVRNVLNISRYRFGVSGPYWYAAGATIQVLLFAMLASKLKMNAPYCHT
jgi:hypothetical protein